MYYRPTIDPTLSPLARKLADAEQRLAATIEKYGADSLDATIKRMAVHKAQHAIDLSNGVPQLP